MNATAWSRDLEVAGGGTGVVSHAGLVLLRQLADRTGLTAPVGGAAAHVDEWTQSLMSERRLARSTIRG